MKKFLALSAALLLSVTLVGCSEEAPVEVSQPIEESVASLEGRYVGYSWNGEANGTSLEDTNQYIETILELDQDGIIQDAKLSFFVQRDGYWTMRQSGNAYVDVDFSVDPTPAEGGADYVAGNSMFTVHTADMMAFYAFAVDNSGDTAVVMVDPITRYQFEMKIPQDFDFDTPVGEMTIGSGLTVPTVRTSGNRAAEWDELADNNIFNVSGWSHVVNDVGVLADIDESSTVQVFLEALGVEFDGGQPQSRAVEYGYFGKGGWEGNHNAIAQSLIGQNATEMTSLVDWSNERYAANINEQNQFGLDTESGATRTVQDSINTISGATVRITREATSYQRALVNAGILSEEDVIIGRF
ncbi:hypothetical protein Amet_1585 [Alkaliphilus metalliredigens QYMF]|uniref:Uncharacterized protein n=1 Tax=Alkaliphilus metalliredigens (strain QYMF) TaxID=293826 RepID=A6TNJ6_ALKMQ|nr:hypothetical protein [Alkaliphilus metalliredigens]ABR47764.1 hypothetical protein Amet_1585 [Alkaliphilus metalliredigens QYMF]